MILIRAEREVSAEKIVRLEKRRISILGTSEKRVNYIKCNAGLFEVCVHNQMIHNVIDKVHR